MLENSGQRPPFPRSGTGDTLPSGAAPNRRRDGFPTEPTMAAPARRPGRAFGHVTVACACRFPTRCYGPRPRLRRAAPHGSRQRPARLEREGATTTSHRSTRAQPSTVSRPFPSAGGQGRRIGDCRAPTRVPRPSSSVAGTGSTKDKTDASSTQHRRGLPGRDHRPTE